MLLLINDRLSPTLSPGPAVQLYLMDLCTYDSFMVVKVADVKLGNVDEANLLSLLDFAVHVLAARVRW
jgi:hypothetical protein